VAVAYGEDQRRQSALHYPEVCYPAQGFAVESKSTALLDLPNGRLPVKRLVTALNKQRYEPLTYWVVVGEHHVEGAIGKKLALMRYGVKGQIADGFIFRVSSIGRDSAQEFEVQQRFIADLMGALQPADRSRLSGLMVSGPPASAP
jgi:EpsI family protein